MSELPSNLDYWRALILFGKTSSTYKMALAKSLISFTRQNKDRVPMDEVAVHFLNQYLERVKSGKPQLATSGRKTVVEQEIDSIKLAGKSFEQSLDVVKEKSLLNMVLLKFNNLHEREIPKPFYQVSEDRKTLLLTQPLLDIFAKEESNLIEEEVSSRWDLLEHAFERIHNVEALDVDEYARHVVKKEKRTNLTPLIPVLNGYQSGFCFYCGEPLYEVAVDHVIPYQAVMHNHIWNLVLSHKFCNEEKLDNLPPRQFVEKLIVRNEYFIASDHPIKNTLVNELGVTPEKRKAKVWKEYEYAKSKVGRIWGGSSHYNPEKDLFYRKWVRILGKSKSLQ